MFNNLKAEMGRSGYDILTLSKVADIKYNTLRSKLSGKTDFTRNEMLNIRNKCFPHLSITYLFLESSDQTESI